jgi:hypothetical protein
LIDGLANILNIKKLLTGSARTVVVGRVVVGRGVVVVVVVVALREHLQSQSAIPLVVANENAVLSPSRRSKNPLSCTNLSGFASFAFV